MKKSDRHSFPISNIGSVTLLMIFIIVCMVCFAALSIAAASSDYRSARKAADHTKAYYTASNESEEIFAGIAHSLKKIYLDSPDRDSFLLNVKEYYSGSDSLTLSPDDSGLLLSYETRISDRQSLLTEIIVLFPQEAPEEAALSTDDLCKIRSFRVINTTEWEGDNSLKLYEKN